MTNLLQAFVACAALAAPFVAVGSHGVTDDIQRKIDAASAAGGGTVTLEAGDYPVASLFLKSGESLVLCLDLHLDRDQLMFDLIQFPVLLRDLVSQLIRLFLQFNTFCSSPDK